MEKIANPKQSLTLIKQIKTQNKTIVLIGGCFDILHLGHITFLEKAKKHGDILLVILESDETIKNLKGSHRPINPQNHRAKLLSSLEVVDIVITIPQIKTNDGYDQLITQISPNVIATTKGDPSIKHKQRQAKLVGAKLLTVTNYIPQKSTTIIEKIISEI